MGKLLRRGAGFHGMLVLDGAGAARSSDSADDGWIRAAIEVEFHVIVTPPIRGKPQPAAGRRNGKRVPFGFQRVGDHACRGGSDVFEEHGIRPFGISDLLASLLCACLCSIDCMLELPSDFRYFHPRPREAYCR